MASAILGFPYGTIRNSTAWTRSRGNYYLECVLEETEQCDPGDAGRAVAQRVIPGQGAARRRSGTARRKGLLHVIPGEDRRSEGRGSRAEYAALWIPFPRCARPGMTGWCFARPG